MKLKLIYVAKEARRGASQSPPAPLEATAVAGAEARAQIYAKSSKLLTYDF